jgi:hypothetical protein
VDQVINDSDLCGLYSTRDGIVYAVGDEVYDRTKGFGRVVGRQDWEGIRMVFDSHPRPFRVLDEKRLASMILAARAMRERGTDPSS